MVYAMHMSNVVRIFSSILDLLSVDVPYECKKFYSYLLHISFLFFFIFFAKVKHKHEKKKKTATRESCLMCHK